MSNNKYIIDKDSLTGIADAVRDKLGVGEATDDDAGYYGGEVFAIGAFNVPHISRTYSVSGSAPTTKSCQWFYSPSINDLITIFGVRPYDVFLTCAEKGTLFAYSESNKVKLKVRSQVSQDNGDNYYPTGNSSTDVNVLGQTLQIRLNNLTNLTSSLFICEFRLYSDRGPGLINGREQILPSWRVQFRDSSGNVLRPLVNSMPFSWQPDIDAGESVDLTTLNSFITSGTPITPIPYSLSDIESKINTYLKKPKGTKNIVANGTEIDVSNYATVDVAVPNPSTGSLDISANGIYDVTEKAEAVVQVPNPSTGSLTINTNGTYDVTEKASAIVNVSPSLQTKTTTISQNGSQIITPDSNYDGLSTVNLTISVPNPSTGSLEITENGTYDVTNKASAIVNVPSSGGLPPFVVPTIKLKSLREDWPATCNFSSIFSTQEQMLEHVIDVLPPEGRYSGKYGDTWYYGLPTFKDKYGRWVSLKQLGVSLPSSLSIGSSWTSYGLTQQVVQNLYNNDLAFGFSSVSNYLSSGGLWFIVFNRYIIGCESETVGRYSNYFNALYTEA